MPSSCNLRVIGAGSCLLQSPPPPLPQKTCVEGLIPAGGASAVGWIIRTLMREPLAGGLVEGHWCHVYKGCILPGHCCHHHPPPHFPPPSPPSFLSTSLSSCCEASGLSLSHPSAIMFLSCHWPTSSEASPPWTVNPKTGSQIQSSLFLNCFIQIFCHSDKKWLTWGHVMAVRKSFEIHNYFTIEYKWGPFPREMPA